MRSPIALDGDIADWKAWGNRDWPTVYGVDRKGRVRYGWEGEPNNQGAPGEAKVRELVDTSLLDRP